MTYFSFDHDCSQRDHCAALSNKEGPLSAESRPTHSGTERLAARSKLAISRKLISDEITGYPTPISGCDAQFNHLLAERQKVPIAIGSLDDAVFVPTPRAPKPAARIESR